MTLSMLATALILLGTATAVGGLPTLRKKQDLEDEKEDESTLGSQDKQAPLNADKKKPEPTKTVRLLITGFGNFPGCPSSNPSSQTASPLHNRLLTSPTSPTRVSITFLGPLPVAYPAISSLVPPLHESNLYDAFVHVGVASGSKGGLRIELRARQTGFKGVGSDGVGPPLKGVKSNAPEESRIDGKGLCAWLKGEECGVKHVETSTEAGLYLCEFIYASSMAAAERQREKQGEGEPKPVLFVHVPDLREEGKEWMEGGGEPVYTAREVTEVLERVCWFVGNGGP